MIQVLVVEDSRITRDAIESQIAKSERYVPVSYTHLMCIRDSLIYPPHLLVLPATLGLHLI